MKDSMASTKGCSSNGYQLMMNYSFLNITELSEIEIEEPREVKNKKPVKVKVVVEKEDEEPCECEKYNCKCLNLSHNKLADVSCLMETFDKIFIDPVGFTWLDLSFNDLTKIDASLCDLHNLKILYLHGNSISELSEIDKLAGLPLLRKLSLHGNPIADIKNYRHYALSLFCIDPDSAFKSFDFSTVTKSDRATAQTWQKGNPQKKKKKAIKD